MSNLITALILAILITAFALLNSIPVSINFVFAQVKDVPLSLVILICALIGAVLSALLALVEQTKQHKKIAELQHKLKNYEVPQASQSKNI